MILVPIQFSHRMNFSVIATDLDGTLFYPKKKIRMVSKKTKQFIRRYTEDGGKVLLVTGRNRFFGDKTGRKTKQEYDFIACNGAIVVSNGEVIFERPFPNDIAQRLVEELSIEVSPKITFLFTKDHNMVSQRKPLRNWVKVGYSLYRFWQGTYREPFYRSDKIFRQELDHGKIYKIMMFPGFGKKSIEVSSNLAKKLQSMYPEINIVASDQALEITYSGCTKSQGLAYYLEYNHINVDNVVVVGDSGNDVSMFKAFPKNSFCMSHGAEDVKQQASFIIDHFSELENYVYPSAETTATND